MQIYIPYAEIEEGAIQYRAVHRHNNCWLHIVYAPQSRTMRLVALPIVGERRSVDYTPEPIVEYHHHEESVHWWRFRVDGQVLQVSLLQGEPLDDNIHALGVVLAVSLLQVEQVSEEVLL